MLMSMTAGLVTLKTTTQNMQLKWTRLEKNHTGKKITITSYKKTVDTLKDRPPLPLSTKLTRSRAPVYSRIATVLSRAWLHTAWAGPSINWTGPYPVCVLEIDFRDQRLFCLFKSFMHNYYRYTNAAAFSLSDAPLFAVTVLPVLEVSDEFPGNNAFFSQSCPSILSRCCIFPVSGCCTEFILCDFIVEMLCAIVLLR